MKYRLMHKTLTCGAPFFYIERAAVLSGAWRYVCGGIRYSYTLPRIAVKYMMCHPETVPTPTVVEEFEV